MRHTTPTSSQYHSVPSQIVRPCASGSAVGRAESSRRSRRVARSYLKKAFRSPSPCHRYGPSHASPWGRGPGRRQPLLDHPRLRVEPVDRARAGGRRPQLAVAPFLAVRALEAEMRRLGEAHGRRRGRRRGRRWRRCRRRRRERTAARRRVAGHRVGGAARRGAAFEHGAGHGVAAHVLVAEGRADPQRLAVEGDAARPHRVGLERADHLAVGIAHERRAAARALVDDPQPLRRGLQAVGPARRLEGDLDLARAARAATARAAPAAPAATAAAAGGEHRGGAGKRRKARRLTVDSMWVPFTSRRTALQGR